MFIKDTKLKIIPSNKVEIITTLSNQEVRKILTENIQPKKGFTFSFYKSKEHKLFEGVFDSDKFEIQRVITGRNSFLPQIKGYIRPNSNGTKLIADLKLHTFVIVFMSFWLSGVSFGLIVTIIGILKQGTNPFLVVFPLIMLAFGIGLVHYGFNSEEEKSINDLKRILSGEIKEKI